MCRIDPANHYMALGRKGCTTVVMKGRDYRWLRPNRFIHERGQGALCQPLLLAELLDRHPAAPVRRDSFGPLVCFWVGRLRLQDSVAHDTTMQRRPVRQEERFTRRLRFGHPPDQITELAGDGRSAQFSMPDFPGPEQAKSLCDARR